MRLLPLLITLSALSACQERTDDLDQDGVPIGIDCDDQDASALGPRVWYADLDADGFGDEASTIEACARPPNYAASADDCNDSNAAAYPGAVETCDGRDEDCDDRVDEGLDLLDLFTDADGDSYGDPNAPAQACRVGGGLVANDRDCDDADAEIKPYAIEFCDGVDEDCDGTPDDGAVDQGTFYADEDDDGWGDAGGSVQACELPAGHVEIDGDCDDSRFDVSPEAEEVCNDIDDDCDGSVDDDPTDASTWYADADKDGYGDPAELAQSCDQPAGYVADASDCDDTSNKISPATVWYADTDADGHGSKTNTTTSCVQPSGYVAKGTDCDDANAAVSPSADEICNDLDDDCDGVADSNAVDALTWYPDEDGDGYGNSGISGVACEQPTGFISVGGDCDDTLAAVSPSADETCDDLDNDCDGSVDDDDPNLTGQPVWYMDADGDGYGDPSLSLGSCDQPSGYLADASDCDDADADVSPAATEYCNGFDDDCDGALDRDDPSNAGDATWYADFDGDGYGDAGLTQTACAQPADYVDVIGDCDDSDALVSPDAVEVCDDWIDNDCDDTSNACAPSGTISMADADAKITGPTSSDALGQSIAALGDVDGDGYADFAVGAYKAGTLASAGQVFVISGASTGTVGASTSPIATFSGTASYDYLGYSIAAPGDVDGDGTPEVLIGAYGAAASGTSDSGVVYLLSADATALTAATTTFRGASSYDYAGYSVSGAGDVDTDGLPDLLIGAYGQDSGGTAAGAVYVVLGTNTGDVTPMNADFVLTGTSGENAGSAVAGGGDLDGDGISDLVIGARKGGTSSAGAVYVVTDGVDGSGSLADSVKLTGTTSTGYAGSAVAIAGDVNGDGFDDLMVGAPSIDTAYVVFGPVSSGSLEDAHIIVTGGSNDETGHSVASAGDVDADGTVDLLIGSPGAGTGGEVYLFLGALGEGSLTGSDADATFSGEASSDDLGTSIAGGFDANADGRDDVLLGAVGEDTAASAAGAVYLLYGSGL